MTDRHLLARDWTAEYAERREQRTAAAWREAQFADSSFADSSPAPAVSAVNFPQRAARAACLTILLGMSVVPAADAQAESATAAISYDQEVRPIFRAHCMSCHNAQDRKAGLALDTYAAAMEGGSSGEVVYAGDLESSRIWALVSHEEEPVMPPGQDKLPADQLDLIRRWIEEGTVESPGTKVKATAGKPSWQFEASAAGTATAGPLPESALCQPVAYTERAAAVPSLCGSPNAPLIAVAGQRQIVLYHADSAELLGVLAFPEGTPHVIRFSADGKLLLAAGGRGGAQGLVALYDVVTGARLAALGDELDVVLAADLTPDLQLVAMGGPSRVVRVLATNSGDLRYELTKHTDWICAVAFSPDGKYLATGDRAGGLRVWEALTGREVQDLPGHKAAVTAVSWRADSKVLASSSEDGSVRLWTIEDAKTIRNWQAHAGGTTVVQFFRDGRLISAGRDAHIRLWDGTGKALPSFGPYPDITLAACFTSSGAFVAGGDFLGNVKSWDAASGAERALLPPNPLTLEMALDAARRQVQALQVTSDECARKAAAAQVPYETAADNCQQPLSQVRSLSAAARHTATAIRELESRLARDEEADFDASQASLTQLRELLAEQQLQLKAAEVALGNLVRQRTELAVEARSAQLALIAVQQQLRQALRTRQEATAHLHEFLVRPAMLRTDLALGEQRLALAEEELAAAQLELARVQSQFGLSEEQGEFEAERGGAADRVAAAQSQVSQAAQQLGTARDRWLFFQRSYPAVPPAMPPGDAASKVR